MMKEEFIKLKEDNWIQTKIRINSDTDDEIFQLNTV